MRLLSAKFPTIITIKETGEIEITCKDGLTIKSAITWLQEGTPEEKASDLTNQLNSVFEKEDIAITAKLVKS